MMDKRAKAQGMCDELKIFNKEAGFDNGNFNSCGELRQLRSGA